MASDERHVLYYCILITYSDGSEIPKFMITSIQKWDTGFSKNHLELGINHPRTQGLFGKDPGIVWSRDSTKINCPRGSVKVSNYMLENVTVNFKYQEWDFMIHRSKRSLTSILYFCLLLNYKSTVAFYQQSSQETNKSYTLKFEVGYSLTNIFSYQTGQSSTFVYFRFYLFLKYAIYRFVVCKR